MKLTKTLPLVVVYSFLFGASTFAQNSNEAVILYNSQPIKVDLSEAGRILSFYGLMPSHMADYELVTLVGKIESVVVENVDSHFDNDSKNAEYAIMSNDRKKIKFENGFATLSSQNIASLNDISASLMSGNNQKVVLIATKSVGENEKLVKNRLNSIITYLGLKGINQKSILTEIQSIEGVENTITVNYIN